MNEQVKIAKINADRDKKIALMNMTSEILKNPVVEIIGAMALVEFLQRTPSKQPIIGNWQGNIIEAGLGGIVAIQQLAPSMPYLTQAAGTILESVSKAGGSILPLLPMLAGGL